MAQEEDEQTQAQEASQEDEVQQEIESRIIKGIEN